VATRLNIAPPNLPIAPNQYERRYQEQLNNVQRLFYNGVANSVNLPYPYGSFYTSPTPALTNPVANATHLVPFGVTAESYNTKIGAVNTRIYVAETAVYNVQFSAQCNLSTGGAASAIYFWLRKNGANVADTAGKVVITGPNAETVAAWNYIISLQENDYIELAWSSSETHMYLEYEAATNGRPAVPAVILTVAWASPLNNSIGQG
jgi:hypothetical protein